MKLTFVLVHGSMHDGSCWDQVIAELNRQGHVAFAPTMAGHGEDAGNFFTQADCVKSVVDYILEKEGRYPRLHPGGSQLCRDSHSERSRAVIRSNQPGGFPERHGDGRRGMHL